MILFLTVTYTKDWNSYVNERIIAMKKKTVYSLKLVFMYIYYAHIYCCLYGCMNIFFS